MRSSLGQFTIGFVLAFSPAPFVGMGTYAFVHGQEAPKVETTRSPQYGAPLQREYGPQEIVYGDPDAPPQSAPASAQPQSGGEMEIETDCARRKRLKKEAEQPKKDPERVTPDI